MVCSPGSSISKSYSRAVRPGRWGRKAAVYFCCLEALQKAGKHAGDEARITITVSREPEGLLFEVADDGAGFDISSTAVKGHGLVNLSDRVGAIGGTIRVDSAPGEGTTISGTVPIPD